MSDRAKTVYHTNTAGGRSHESAAIRIARGVIRAVDQAVDLIFLTLIVVAVLFAVYSIWDRKQIYTSSDAAVYEDYKPAAEKDSQAFDRLRRLNPNVCAWISIEGTGIDYPVVQGRDNQEYLNKTVTGEFALGGSIFLDSSNRSDFSEFNSVIYGHHMEKGEMFGNLDKFDEKAFFDGHPYGSLYFDKAMHRLTIFAMVEADAYDFRLYDPHVGGEADLQGEAASESRAEREQEYLDYVNRLAKYTRDIGVKPGDHIVMLSTCALGTNERYALYARIDRAE